MKTRTVLALMAYAFVVGYFAGHHYDWPKQHRQAETPFAWPSHEYNRGMCAAYEQIAHSDAVYLGPVKLTHNASFTNCVFISLPVPNMCLLVEEGTSNITVNAGSSAFYSYQQ